MLLSNFVDERLGVQLEKKAKAKEKRKTIYRINSPESYLCRSSVASRQLKTNAKQAATPPILINYKSTSTEMKK